ncbi:MAG: hypoxanthine phosphoribosyltransferase [Clostridiaceae bacterium]|nr:hypoxanthine phosphoribosyltransferase [Clostridiaceae bacterium]
MLEVIERILITREELQAKVKELAAQISKDYEGKELFLVSVLKGGFMFTADLMREITIPCEIDFMAVSSYGQGSKTSGVVKIVKDLDQSVEGKDILVVEDILDSGLTLSYLKQNLLARGAKSVKVCTILNKEERRKADIKADYLGFEIPDEFVVGYGLDYAEKYRNFPFVGVLKKEVYQK